MLAWDLAIARACSSLAGWPPLDAIMSALTLAGVWGALWLAIGIGLALHHRGFVVGGLVRLVWSVLIATLIVSITKPLVGRHRPPTEQLTRTTATAIATERTEGYSFPSGHAAQAVAGAYALAFMWPRRRKPVWVLAGLMLFSRLYLGVHYPLDLAAGALVGWAAARVATARTPCYISGSASAASRVPR